MQEAQDLQEKLDAKKAELNLASSSPFFEFLVFPDDARVKEDTC